MMDRTVSFGKIKFRSLLFASGFAQILQVLSLMSGTLIVGNIVGEIGLSGINVVTPAYSGAFFVAGLIGTGTVYLYARELGCFQTEHASQLFSQSLLLSIAAGILMFGIMAVGEESFLSSLGLSAAVRAEAEAYWFYEKYIVLLVPSEYFLSLMVFADGDGLISSVSNGFCALSQILFSIVFTLRMGTKGASLGVMLSYFLTILLLLLHFVRKNNSLRFRWHFSWRDLRETVSLSIVDCVWTLCVTVVALFLNAFIIRNYTDAYLPISTLAIGMVEVTLSFDAIGQGMSALAEVYLGEENYSDERDLAKHCLWVALAVGTAAMVLLLLTAPLLPRLYDITSPELLPHCRKLVRLMALSMPLCAVKFMLTSQYLLVRRIRLSVAMVVVSSVVLPVLLIGLLGRMAGMDQIWLAYLLSEALTLMAAMSYEYWHDGRKSLPWLLPDDGRIPTMNRSVYLTPEEIIKLRNEAESFLIANDIAPEVIRRVMLMIEECGTVIREKNAGKRVVMECSLLLEEKQIRAYLRDTGEIFDLTDRDSPVTGIASYLVSNLMETFSDKRYLTTVSYNRLAFFFPR